MDDQRAAVKSRPGGEDGAAEGEKLASQRADMAVVCPQNSVYTNVGVKEEGKE